MSNETINLMQSHRSIRQFTEKEISKEMLNQILNSAISAASSSLLQCVSLIRVTDLEKRQKLVELTGNQMYVKDCAEFFIFCADFNRNYQVVPDGHFGFTEQVLTAAIDAGLMGQNALLSAQPLGLGGVFIGGIRNHPLEVCKLLSLPKQVFPLFGLCLGYPNQNPQLKPRLPLSVIVYENNYQSLDKKELEKYDQEMKDYYQKRTDNKKSNTWSEDMKAKLNKEARPFILAALNKQGLALK